MSRKLLMTILAAVSALAASSPASAQFSGEVGTPGVSPATPPALIAPLPSGNNTSGINQPGAPNTSTPGLIGTGAAASGLPGESVHHPGFPGRIGNMR